jgi:uncharacterized radical SAM superfamily Fe-S cluster-containing enzyme
MKKTIRRTFREPVRLTSSVCPVCLRQLPAEIVRAGTDYTLEKTCPEHGFFSAVVWRGYSPSLETWGGALTPPEPAPPDCPHACGLCASHLRKTCCVLLEVTSRCNLKCPVCFAASGGADAGGDEPSVGALFEQFRKLARDGNTFVQLSGGEPTVRDDLPEIVAAAKKAGCENIQLNTNGLRLGADCAYTKALADAGLSFVFMQFDGTKDAIYETIRGRPLLEQKIAAIDACGANLLGVTLVPTVIPGINDHNIGDYQPVSYFGRYPIAPRDADRITLPEILRAVEQQTGGLVRLSDFAPSCCDHPRCTFHGDFVVLPDSLVRLGARSEASSCCGGDTAHLKNRNFVARRWKRADAGEEERPGADYQDMETFLRRVRTHGFTVTAMAFQDAYTLDLERLRRCSLHVYRDGRTIPFCAYYLSPYEGA